MIFCFTDRSPFQVEAVDVRPVDRQVGSPSTKQLLRLRSTHRLLRYLAGAAVGYKMYIFSVEYLLHSIKALWTKVRGVDFHHS